ncbi:MAG TPA: methyltransferase domain-containing protein [Candidatus Methylomirabilis sp.]|nr:methyltransferase domain-containing protein [Candidatus Methylomirabilis sp.]
MVAGQDPRFFYDTIADKFEGLDHPHDVRTRLEIVFDVLLDDSALHGRRVLDAGCGYGAFSRVAGNRGARVVSCDIAEKLVLRASTTTPSHGVVCDACALGFKDGSFATVISSEMVEHVERPVDAVKELARVLEPGGLLVITTPSRPWQGVVRMASRLRLRPFHGLENFLWWSELETACAASGLQILRHIGFHAWPFQMGLSGLSRSVDRRFGDGPWARLMINQAVLARKPA